VLEQASDIQDAVGVEHESPKLIPVIVTMLPAESAVLTTLDALATGAAKRESSQVLSSTHTGKRVAHQKHALASYRRS
jgi:hypothetical protein